MDGDGHDPAAHLPDRGDGAVGTTRLGEWMAMNRLFEMLENPKQFAYGDETLIYFNGEKMIILTHEGEDDDLVQIEGKVDKRLLEWLKGLLEQ